MGYNYDNPLVYDWDGTYDEGPLSPVVPPNHTAPRRLPLPAGVPNASPTRAKHLAALSANDPLRMYSGAAEKRSAAARAHWADLVAKQQAARLRLDQAQARESATRAHWSGVDARQAVKRLRLDRAAAQLANMIRTPWAGVTGKQAATALAWGAALARAMPATFPWRQVAEHNGFVRLRWRAGYPNGTGYTLPFGGDPDPPPGSTIIIPPMEAYFMIPALTIVRTSDSADLNAIDATLKLDIGSYAWSLDATIPREQLALVDPATNSEPVPITVNVNGYSWACIVEGYTDNRKFGGTGCKIRGRGPSALLGAPYAPLTSFSSGAAADASTLATNLMPTGWTLTWSTQDWLVPAGLFTYADAAPIDALAQLANAVGACIVPAQTAQSLTVQPLYPTSPWNWSSATPYADVPASFICELAGQWEGNFKTDYNGIYVSGQNSGIVGLVKLTGTAGDVLLPTVTDQLLCVQAANVERGRIELAKASKRKTETHRTLLLPPGGSGNPGVFPVGSLVQITEPTAWASGAWLAQVMAVEISAARSGSALSVRQTLTLERHA